MSLIYSMLWKIMIIFLLLVFSFMIVLYSMEPRLIERGLYRIGIQENICEPLDKSKIKEIPKKIAIVADIGTTENGFNTLENMKSINPELFLFVGDLSYETPDHWFNQTGLIKKEKIKIAFADEEISDKQVYLEYYNLENVFYSFELDSVQFIVLTMEEPYNQNSSQYNFLVSTLNQTINNEILEWKIVLLHAPIYSSNTEISHLRDELQPVFDKFDVDLVIHGDVHGYERTFPLLFDEKITDFSKCTFDDPKGEIFITVGTGGHSHSPFIEKKEWSIIQNDNDYGFLSIGLYKNEKTLIGEFISNNGNIVDSFQIRK
ncbi:MAG: hypothetical protein DWQ18_09445 [Crenarchaeota archaeon]|nr:MAG: hypothetical protein DWQ17_00340 [Thermoproteota archaeon]RDJ33351.1 MAG: hypothetical protein DWQ18_09445 [Thermoproteota archaeon]RDJ38777.1 MAG: hypothetical protein DWQ13_00340 [Thermoproteota archaeon]